MGLKKSHRLMIIIGISSLFFAAEISTGFYTRSLALIADAFHYLNDLVGFLVALVAFRMSERTDSPKGLAFGWQRANLLGAFFNGVFLLALGVSVLLQSIERFVTIERVNNPKIVLIMGCVGFTLNVISATVLHEHDEVPHRHVNELGSNGIELQQPNTNASERHSHEHGDLAPLTHKTHRHETQARDKSVVNGHDLGLLGVLLHVIGDAANNVGVIIAAAIIWKTNFAGRFYADPVVSTLIGLMILLTSIPLVWKSGVILLESVPQGVDPDDVKHDIEKISGVLGLHELRIWRLNQQKSIASAHVIVSAETIQSFNDLAKTITECFHAYGIHSVTLQPESIETVPDGPAKNTLEIMDSSGGLRQRVAEPLACLVGCRTGTICGELTCCD